MQYNLRFPMRSADISLNFQTVKFPFKIIFSFLSCSAGCEAGWPEGLQEAVVVICLYLQLHLPGGTQTK